MDYREIDFSTLTEITKQSDKFFIAVDEPNNKGFFLSTNVELITGYTSQELNDFPDKHYTLISQDSSQKVKSELASVHNPTINFIELLYTIKSKNGKIVWIKELLNIIRDDKKNIVRKISFCSDVSDLKNNEQKSIDAADTLRNLNSAKDKFISIVSHDLRAPFTTLLGFSEILLNEKDLGEDERNEYLQYIYDASKNQLDMINCLLDWSRLQTGRVKVEPIRLNVKNSIANAITPLTGDAVRKNIDIKFDINPDLHINADERLFGQAIYSLTSNAIKFTPEGKAVFISSTRFKEGMIEIVVRDEGLGIAEEHHHKLFRIDQKFSLTGTNGEKGSGLGLTLMNEIVEKHGGQVWFYSQIGEGSEFHFTIPEAKNFVLIVEDEKSVSTLYKRKLETDLKNFEFVTAENGYEAIGMVKSLLPTIVITDHDMPLMNGIQLVEAIQKKDSGRNIPIIVVSAKLNDDIISSYSKLGVDKIIQKPVDLDNLIVLMKDCLF